MGIWAQITQGIEAQGRCVLVSVIATRGSVPREAGARMVVRPDGGFHGTIGGGRLEWQALAQAQKLFVSDCSRGFITRDLSLGPELGQCCGGRVTLAFEMFDVLRLADAKVLARSEADGAFATCARLLGDAGLTREFVDLEELGLAEVLYEGGALMERFGASGTPLYLFGAGHVARALVLALAPLPFTVKWIDPRADAFPGHVPANVTCRFEADPAGVLAEAGDGDFVLVMTHSHALDQAVIHEALKRDHFGYVGLIGSDTKRARFVSRMRAGGLGEAELAGLVCPIGIGGIRSKEPASLAASVVAELLQRREAACLGEQSTPMLAKRVGDVP